jgi:hypothetical protein
VIQNVTTNTASEINRLSAFPLVTLLGLLTKVAPKSPQKQVKMRLSEILQIIEVSKQVTLAVDREWQTEDGATKKRRYQCKRFSPKHLRQVHDALLTLYNTSVRIQRWNKEKQRLDQQVHILDTFGYVYENGGKALDMDDLPPDREKVNVGTDERPVWRLRRQTENGGRFDRPTGIVFRLNAELANELSKQQGTLGFTLIACKVFAIFKQYMKRPAMIRLIMLVLRQTGPDFRRNLQQLVADLGFDATHPVRAAEDLGRALAELQQLRLVTSFTMDTSNDKLAVVCNRDWHREATRA